MRRYRSKYQSGGPLASQKSFFSSYIQSPKYMERLKKQGYTNPSQVMKDRLARMSSTQFSDVTGTGLSSEYRKDINTIYYDNDETKKYEMTKESVKAHELAHAAGAMNVFAGRSYNDPIGLNTNDINAIDARNKLAGRIMDDDSNISHDSRASEFKADMDTLRYYLKKDNIYDAGTQDFNAEFLKKAKEKYSKDKNVNRLFQRATDKDLIWLMNNIAYQDQSQDMGMAQMGGDMKSILGYSRNSPYRNDPFIDIFTPEGLIDMSQTDVDLVGIDNLGNKKRMKANSKNPYKFEGDIVREIPLNPYQQGGMTKEMFDYLFNDDDDDDDEVQQPVQQEEVQDNQILVHEKADKKAFERMQEEMALNEAMTWNDEDDFRRNPYEEEFFPDELSLPTNFQSSGKYGTQNIGEYGKKIAGELTSALGYSPTFNSIYRSPAQQAELIRAGKPAVRNSYHLSGNAIDLKPSDWKNLTPQKQQYFKNNYDVVYHNNHYHIEPR